MATKKMAACKCADGVDKALQKRGARLVLTISLTGAPAKTIVATQHLEGAKKRSPITLAALFCPFCGAKYPIVLDLLRAVAEVNGG